MFGVCLAVGGGLLIAGLALGGTLVDATVTLGNDESFIGDFMDHGLLRFGGSNAKEVDETESADKLTVPATDISKLDIKLRGCDLRILSSDDDQIHVEVDSDEGKNVSLKQDDDTLTISDAHKNIANVKAASVSIRIPESHAFDEVSIRLAAGDMEIDRLTADEISIQGGTGQLHVGTLTAKQELDAGIGAGEFRIEEAVLGETSIKCGIGTLEIASCTLNGDADINGGVGEVNVGIASEKDDFNYELKCGLGELEVFGDSYTSLGKGREIDNGASDTISLECGVGSVSVYAQ